MLVICMLHNTENCSQNKGLPILNKNVDIFSFHAGHMIIMCPAWKGQVVPGHHIKRITHTQTQYLNNIIMYLLVVGQLSALTCCVNVRLLSAMKKITPLIYSQSWVGSWVYTTQAMMTFTLIF